MGAAIPIIAAAIPALIAMGKELFPPAGSSPGDVSAAGAKKMADMQKAASAYGAYRPDQADARMKAMAQQMSAYKGAGNIMQAMYGGSGGGGSYTPSGGGYKPPFADSPDPNKTSTDFPPGWTPQTYADYQKWAQAQRDYQAKMGVPKGTPVSPPIYVPPPNMPGGTGAGSSGTSFVDPDSLFAPPDSSLNAMSSSLARKPRV